MKVSTYKIKKEIVLKIGFNFKEENSKIIEVFPYNLTSNVSLGFEADSQNFIENYVQITLENTI